jgi:hypothetical protein
MTFPPKQMFVPPGTYEYGYGYESVLGVLTTQDLVDHKVIAPVHVSEVEQQMARTSTSAWQSVCDLGLKPATLLDLEVRAQMTELRHRHPELDEEGLFQEGMRMFRGACSPARLKETLREKSGAAGA